MCVVKLVSALKNLTQFIDIYNYMKKNGYATVVMGARLLFFSVFSLLISHSPCFLASAPRIKSLLLLAAIFSPLLLLFLKN